MFTLFSPSLLRALRLLHLTGFLSYSKLLKNETSPKNDFKPHLGLKQGASRTEGRKLDQLSLVLALLVLLLPSPSQITGYAEKTTSDPFFFFN